MTRTYALLFALGLLITSRGFATEWKNVAELPSFRAEDGSFIRNLPGLGGVQSVHCRLPAGEVIQACRHRTVAQIWYVLSGEGEMWLADTAGRQTTFPLTKGTVFTVPLGDSFQFRNAGRSDLEILIVNTTPWSGKGELIPVPNHWAPRFH